MKRPILLNGRFLSVGGTGVQRVAAELIRALDEIVPDQEVERKPLSIAVKGRNRDNKSLPRLVNTETESLFGHLPGAIWEQTVLAFWARGSFLVNLCNSGPLFHHNSVVMIHDAQVYLSPRSYNRIFVKWYRFSLPILGKSAKKIITVSQYSKDRLIEFGVAKEEKIHVIYNGCDHILRVAPEPEYVSSVTISHPFVLALASTQMHKNISLLINSFMAEELRGVELVLFGKACKEDFELLGVNVSDNVRFVGHVSDSQLVSLFNDASAFLCPSLTEGFGLPPLEAMAIGCPCIVAPCGALPEVCGDAVLYADQNDHYAWTQTIRRILDDPLLASELRRKGFARSKQFNWQQSANELLALVAGLNK